MHVTFLIYLFVTSRNLLFGVFLLREMITILRKIAVHFRQVSLKRVLLSVGVLECFGKILLKYLWKSWIFKNPLLHLNSSQVIFKVSRRIFLHLLTCPLIYRRLFVSYKAHILCIRIHICKRYCFPLLLFLRWKAKEK